NAVNSPNTTTAAAPTEAPEETPRMNGSASGLRTSDCTAAPTAARPAPTTAASSTRGVRTCQMIVYEVTSSALIEPPVSAAQMYRTVLPGGAGAAPCDVASGTGTASTPVSAAASGTARPRPGRSRPGAPAACGRTVVAMFGLLSDRGFRQRFRTETSDRVRGGRDRGRVPGRPRGMVGPKIGRASCRERG